MNNFKYMKNIFLKELYKPSNDLYNNILNRINNEKNIVIIRRKLIFTSIIFVVSISCFVSSVLFFLSAASQSGFSQIFSLMFSDFKIISNYYSSFVVSLLESLPIFNIILFLCMTLFLSFVTKYLIKEIKDFSFCKHVKY